MKKFVIILLILIFVTLNCIFLQNLNKTTLTQSEPISEFAQIKQNNVYLYRNADELSKWFLLEETYFVKILKSYNENYFEVEYLSLNGYVKKDEVQFVKETPSFPYLDNINFCTGNTAVNLREKPTNESNSIMEILPNTNNVLYIGKIVGKQVDENLGNIWVYCKVENVYGYIYFPYVKNLDSINSNIENFTVVSSLSSNPINSLLYLNLSTQNLLIFATCVPVIFLVILFLKHKRFN